MAANWIAHEKNFGNALETYFKQGGHLCLAHFDICPAEVNANPFWRDREHRIKALVDAGIAFLIDTETRTGILAKQTASHYQLTDLGKTYFRKAENGHTATHPKRLRRKWENSAMEK